MISATAIPYVRADGDPFEAGLAHGNARGAALRAFIDDDLCRLNRIMAVPVSMAELAPTIAAYREAIAESTPELAREVHGLAEGAGISEEQAWLLQLRREIMGYLKVPTMGDCTTYARCAAAAGGHGVLAQTIDLNGDLDDQVGVLEVARRGSSRRALVLSFGGLLGYLGVNSDGLAIGLNLVLGGDWGCGLPPYLAIRHLLDHAGSVDEAVSILRGLRLASSRSLTLCDAAKTVNVEILDNELRLVQAAESVHTNHFLDPDFAQHDELNVFARNFSVLRLTACRQALATLPADASVEDHFALLSAAPICVANTGDIRREHTVATVVMVPELGTLHVKAGTAQDAQCFELR
jgi:isopenicillin-N N-acyltransferase like protein